MAKTAFTIEPTDPAAGFTDQLMQFGAFYKLGLHLGYEYLHTAFISRRSNGSDIAPQTAGPGTLVHMAPNLPHSVLAETETVMLLTMVDTATTA